VASILRAETHPSNIKTIPNKAIENIRAVIPRNPLEELLRLESMGKKAARKAISSKRARKASRKIPSSERI
jgi:hypothetical protein